MLDITIADPEHPGPDIHYSHLRTPGQIQGLGAMLTLHPTTLRVLGASENVGTELGTPHAAMLGRSLYEVIEGDEAIMKSRRTSATVRRCLRIHCWSWSAGGGST